MVLECYFMRQLLNQYSLRLRRIWLIPTLPSWVTILINLGFKPEKCVSEIEGESTNCMVNLTISVVIVFAAKQFLVQAYEVIAPFCSTRIDRRRRARILTTVVPEVYKDMTLKPITYIDLYSEYDTKMMQLGYVVMFSSSFTLAPLLAWGNNVLEMRSDCFKYLAYYKRPFAEQARGIGTWERIIKSMIKFGIFSNAVILSFSSQGMNRLVFKYIGLNWKYQIIFQIAFIIVYEVIY